MGLCPATALWVPVLGSAVLASWLLAAHVPTLFPPAIYCRFMPSRTYRLNSLMPGVDSRRPSEEPGSACCPAPASTVYAASAMSAASR